MDMDLGAGAVSSTRRTMDTTNEAAEITPLGMYDSARAKIAANLRWLFAKAYGIGNVFVYLYNEQCRVTNEPREAVQTPTQLHPEQNVLEYV